MLATTAAHFSVCCKDTPATPPHPHQTASSLRFRLSLSPHGSLSVFPASSTRTSACVLPARPLTQRALSPARPSSAPPSPAHPLPSAPPPQRPPPQRREDDQNPSRQPVRKERRQRAASPALFILAQKSPQPPSLPGLAKRSAPGTLQALSSFRSPVSFSQSPLSNAQAPLAPRPPPFLVTHPQTPPASRGSLDLSTLLPLAAPNLLQAFPSSVLWVPRTVNQEVGQSSGGRVEGRALPAHLAT